MGPTDDGLWMEVTEADYRAFLAGHPRREHFRRAVWDEGDRGPMFYVYDAQAFEADQHHNKSPTSHKVAWRVADQVDGRMRFWIPNVSG